MDKNQEITMTSSDTTLNQLDDSSLSWKIYLAFKNKSQISASDAELISYATQELNVDVTKLPQTFVEILPLVLIGFMNVFFVRNGLNETNFPEFQSFMINMMKIAIDLIRDDNTIVDFSPYAIQIGCPPDMLNTMAFSRSKDDVILSQHEAAPWRELNTIQLLNWPYVEVTFRTKDLFFLRRQATEYLRYLNSSPHTLKVDDNENKIEHVETLRHYESEKRCYTERLLEEYIKDYMGALKTVKDITWQKLEEIQTVLEQFLEDVKFLNLKSMISNSVVLINLTPKKYYRYKTLEGADDDDEVNSKFGYSEILSPKIELVLFHFRGKQKNVPYIRFELPDKIRKSDINKEDIIPYIAYKCTFCKIEFDTNDAKTMMLEHLQKEHRMELNLTCGECQESLDVSLLTERRWKHTCTVLSNTQNK